MNMRIPPTSPYPSAQSSEPDMGQIRQAMGQMAAPMMQNMMEQSTQGMDEMFKGSDDDEDSDEEPL